MMSIDEIGFALNGLNGRKQYLHVLFVAGRLYYTKSKYYLACLILINC